ncbi:MAG TPA: type I-E CRISPR-associated protein Cas7/Cse4/CasC [Elusimicrobiales bacterium]|nr:type I-E CRISPR-associated protein Cas7/Cse4/CasC [Elusimicrobiales bacterium]HPO95032.1 type I-E CRISPR-associated protein Cas7/Cse4/CasC [Elusimicrobiales bacterium]
MNKETKNPYEGLRLEFHILQSFPVTCLNRDDVGSPKTALVGGVTRARVSSQCWKRYVREEMRDLGANLGFRTKYVGKILEEELKNIGANEEQAKKLSQDIENILNESKKSKKKSSDEEENDDEPSGKTDTLLFLSKNEIKKIAQYIKDNKFELKGIKETKDLEKILGDKINKNIDALDIALFGRMVAKANKLDVQAASSFSHAISTHRVANEVEFFTALDDFQEEKEIQGSGHMGTLEFNSATYYRYINLDIDQLYETLSEETDIMEAIEKFVKALFIAVPMARQNTQAGYCPWEFARIYIRKGQPLQAHFETPVKPENGGFLEPSKKELKNYLDKKEKLYGSLFNKISMFEFGEDESLNIDKLIENIKSEINKVKK